MNLSWIIPTYNEEKRIGKTLQEVDVYLRSKNLPGGYEIIVADSASKDRTRAIVEGLKSQIPNLKFFNLESRGKGWAIRGGMLEAQGDIRLFSDADNSTEPRYFDDMEKYFKQGYDIVISSRHPKDVPGASRDIKEPWYREILGRLGNFIIQTFGVWGIWDTQNGFKALTAKAAENIFSRLLIKRFAFDVEMLALARRFGYKIAVIPVRWRFDPDSKVTLKAYFQFFGDVFKIRWYLITNKYKIK